MKKKVAFICVHNSCRSQMAEGWAKHLGENIIDFYSAGTENYPCVKEGAIKVMEEVGVDMSKNYPKLLKDIPGEIDIVITMGCNVSCPYIPCTHIEDWGLVDPSGGTLDEFRYCRDLIKAKVENLILQVKNGEI